MQAIQEAGTYFTLQGAAMVLGIEPVVLERWIGAERGLRTVLTRGGRCVLISSLALCGLRKLRDRKFRSAGPEKLLRWMDRVAPGRVAPGRLTRVRRRGTLTS